MVSERVREMAGAMVVPSTIVPDGQLIVVDRRGGVLLLDALTALATAQSVLAGIKP